MNKEQIQELMMGAAMIAVVYALWRNFKPAPAKVSAKAAAVTTAAGAQARAGGAAFAYGEPSPFTSMNDLLGGTVKDTGTWEGIDYLEKIESAPRVIGNGPRVAGGYW
jgi:hypothetical protein